MRRLTILALGAVAIGFLAYKQEEQTQSPIVITPETVVDSQPPQPEVGGDEQSGATDLTSAKAEVQSLTWQLEVIKEQLAEAQAKIDNASSMPETPVMDETPAIRSAPRGHYEWKRTGLLRRKKVWVNE